MDLVVDAQDLEDPSPDVGQLFQHYDDLYFLGALRDAGVSVKWGSSLRSTTSAFGSCSFQESSKTITLYEPVLQYRSPAELKNALLHLMIHAVLYLKHDKIDPWNHGPIFRHWMYAINDCSVEDHRRPPGGYSITTTHDFSPESSCNIHMWECELCGDTILRATKLGPPAHPFCIENGDEDAICGNILCRYHNHKTNCSGRYSKMVSESPATPGQKKVREGAMRLLTRTSEMPKSQRTEQKPNPDEFQKNATVAKPNAGGNLLSLMGGMNAKSPGSISLKKEGKWHEPEDVRKSSYPCAAPKKKRKMERDLVVTEKPIALPAASPRKLNRLYKISSSTMAGTQHKHEAIQKTVVQSDASRSKLKQASLVAPEETKYKTNESDGGKEYGVKSAWMNYYALEESSESDVPLINKRSERRKRERERERERERAIHMTYSRRKRSASGNSSIKTRANIEDLSQQDELRSSCSDIVVIPSSEEVTTEGLGDKSQRPAPCSIATDQLVPAQSVNPPRITPSNPRSVSVVDISDGD